MLRWEVRRGVEGWGRAVGVGGEKRGGVWEILGVAIQNLNPTAGSWILSTLCSTTGTPVLSLAL